MDDEDLPATSMAFRDPASGASASSSRRTWVRKSAAAVIIEVDDSMEHVLGWTPQDLLGKTSLDFIHPDDQTLAVEGWMQMLGSAGSSSPFRFRHRHRDGSWRWVEMVNHNLLDDPSQACVVAEMTDVTDEPTVVGSLRGTEGPGGEAEGQPLQLHEALRAREQLLHRLSEALPVGVLHVDASGRVLYTNQRLLTILENGRAATFLEQFSKVVTDDVPRMREAFETALQGGLDNDIEVRIAAPGASEGKEIRQCTLNVRALSTDSDEIIGAVACLVDVTESVRMQEQLRRQATFDTLTRCFNRASTMDALDKMLADAPEGGGPAVIFIDLDDFKDINDQLGHGAGDEMLEIVARRLRRVVREDDVVGRIGGDEFLVLCPGISSAPEAFRAATRVARSLRCRVRLQVGEVSCRASVGVTWTAAATVDADALIAHADSAMYEAKRSDLDRPVLYSPPG